MDEFEKWWEEIADGSVYPDDHADDVTYRALDMYRSMTCKMKEEKIEAGYFWVCSECNHAVTFGWGLPTYCPNCGRKVQKDG